MKKRMNIIWLSVAVLAILLIVSAAYYLSTWKSGVEQVKFEPFNIYNNFTIIVLPDIQKYVANQNFSEILTNQTRWIVASKDNMNIKFAIFEGDLVDFANSKEQWERTNKSLSVLDGKVEYSVVPGNHDHPLDNFNKFFPVSRFSNEKYGFFGDNSNNYHLLDAGNAKFIILSLDYCPDKEEISWAGSVLRTFSQREAIFVTHGYLDTQGNISVNGCDTKYLFSELVVKNPNILLVLSGHFHGEARRVDKNLAGGKVYQLLADYQSLPNGGNGWLRILDFSGDKIYVKTYSPYLDKYKNNKSEFVLELN